VRRNAPGLRPTSTRWSRVVLAALLTALSVGLSGVGARASASTVPSAPGSGGTGIILMSEVGADHVASAASNPNDACATGNSAGAGPFASQVLGIEKDIAQNVGVGYPGPVFIEVNTKNVVTVPGDTSSLMYTWGCTDGHVREVSRGPVDECTIHVQARATSGSSSDLREELIHELTHCLLFQRFGSIVYDFPAWYAEGAADWVANELNGSHVVDRFWEAYLANPNADLFTRSYDAIGFFVHLEESGTDVWHTIVPMGAALAKSGLSNVAAWKAANPSTEFLNNWGSGFAEGRYPGQAWDSGGSGLPKSPGPVPEQRHVRNNDDPVGVKSVAAGAKIQPLDVDSQVIHVTVGAGSYGRISLGHRNDATLAETAGVNYCSDGTGCTCPAGSPEAGATFTAMEDGLEYATVTGGLKSGKVTLTGESLKTFCKPRSCLVGSWTQTDETNTGNPYLVGFSGGSGMKLTISPSGHFTEDWDGSTPLRTSKGGSLSYTGIEAGTVHLPTDAAATSGAFVLGSQTGSITADLNGKDTSFRAAGSEGGTFTCQGNTLSINLPDGGEGTNHSTFTSAGG
jgi:hypothetical protein